MMTNGEVQIRHRKSSGSVFCVQTSADKHWWVVSFSSGHFFPFWFKTFTATHADIFRENYEFAALYPTFRFIDAFKFL